MEQNESIENDWREEVSDSKATLKVQDGEKETFVFLSEGEKKAHADFGTSIVFEVEQEGNKKNLYVRETNWALRQQIKELGELTGKAVTLSRVGSKKSDTRYTIMEEDKEKQEAPEEEETTPETP